MFCFNGWWEILGVTAAVCKILGGVGTEVTNAATVFLQLLD